MSIRALFAVAGVVAMGGGLFVALRFGAAGDAGILAGGMIVFGLIISRRAILGTAGATAERRQSALRLIDWAQGGDFILRRCGAVLLIAGITSLLIAVLLMLLRTYSIWPLIVGAASLAGGGLALVIERAKRN